MHTAVRVGDVVGHQSEYKFVCLSWYREKQVAGRLFAHKYRFKTLVTI